MFLQGLTTLKEQMAWWPICF